MSDIDTAAEKEGNAILTSNKLRPHLIKKRKATLKEVPSHLRLVRGRGALISAEPLVEMKPTVNWLSKLLNDT